ncbi:hypothetical protein [Vibrio sp. Hep-1b-8]|uniref:hypothetical protein n=1 Tax=Vibrio sp. Hep-1b-8 TaxID=2144187 RepID=UPI001110A8FA|nr:hypothetical protein [Vibrio sp. Hep-1b-8]TMX35215.1 hypothetical protein DA100_14390 [Vibrio sp. Hep-1b-8]
MTSNIDLDFYNLLREAVHKKWDPIGVCSYSEEMGEYDGYLPNLYKLLKDGSSEEEVFNFLWSVETDAMGLSGDEHATRKFSKFLIKLNK